ncbi:hypothetical protein HYH03_015986 [Edaphochlamys debaryana]|uniref:Glycosyltransferase 61 catalytic domain-containing protein n=1 Tax=Edaphochlamys debaryana TaxID=47281 RepID=A0A835XJM0_9CHLO|nr:hypothetical protein HYH03_015986 [Edaphochlamys debaryana]|eukprot:KAG2485313.1 hypothetical protein HYH03_015986 [Edaphochlamys debaryana]
MFESWWWVFNDVCVEDESIVVYDPQVVGLDPTGEKTPRVDLSAIQYMFRHAPYDLVRKAVEDGLPHHVGNATQHSLDLPNAVHTSNHHRLPYQLNIRYPTEREVASKPKFSGCTVPVLTYCHWPHNFGEYFIRTPSIIHRFQEIKALSRNMTYLVGLPPNMPADPFNIDLLRPLSIYEPTTWREFSRPLPEGTPSNHTAEGVAVRCFERMIVGRLQGGSYPEVVRTAEDIYEYYAAKPGGPPPKGPRWHSNVTNPPNTIKVLIEHRPYGGTRQFLHSDELLRECNSAAPLPGPDGRQIKVECRLHTFGASLVEDLRAVGDADVLVAFHGAGAMNAAFMPRRSSLLEVRPREFGTKHGGWPNQWQPTIAHQSKYEHYFFWGLCVDDPELSPPGEQEAAGLEGGAFAARDRHVHLKWPMLKTPLERILQIKGSVDLYEEAVVKNDLMWLVEPGGSMRPAPELTEAIGLKPWRIRTPPKPRRVLDEVLSSPAAAGSLLGPSQTLGSRLRSALGPWLPEAWRSEQDDWRWGRG